MLSFLRGGNRRTKTIWWILIIVTVVTFVGGFVFLFGAGLDSSKQASATGAVGTVNGRNVSREEWLATLSDQKAQFKSRYGVDPADRDEKSVETQAWRTLVVRRLFETEAEREHIGVTPREIVIAMQTSPPTVITSQPTFQTNGQFDSQKYGAALRDPSINWSPVEDLVRGQLPVRKLQERLISSIKITEPELAQTFHERFDRAVATLLMVPGTPDTAAPPPTEDDLKRTYEKYKSRFMTTPHTQLEMLVVPKEIGETEVAVARDAANGFAARARAGEDWNALVRDYSDVQTGSEGGVVDRLFQPAEFGPEMGPKIAAMKVGGVTEPMRDGTRFIVFKILDRPAAAPGAPGGIKVGQLVVRIRGDEDRIRKQFQDLGALRKRAASAGLGTAAAEKGLATSTSEFYNSNSTPQALVDVPEAADWGIGSKVGAVGPVFEGVDVFALVQVKTQQPGGAVPRDRVGETLRQLAQMEGRVDRAKPAADAISRAITGGQTLEQAAAANRLTVQRIDNVTRHQLDPRIGGAPELAGMLFAAAPGRNLGPVRGLNGWYFGRLESVSIADTAAFNQMKVQLANELVQRKQQTFFSEYVAALREKARITDLRSTLY